MSQALNDPLTVFGEASAALARRDWRTLAALCDPWSLSQFQQQIVSQYGPRPDVTRVTADTFRHFHPDMPQAVAEYQVAQHRKREQERRLRIDDEISGVTSYEELVALTPTELFARWLEAHSLGAQVTRLLRQYPRVAESPEASVSAIGERSLEALGVVRDGEWAYVVYRDKELDTDDTRTVKSLSESPTWWDDPRWRLVRIAPVHKQGTGEWRLIADHAFLLGQRQVSGIELRHTAGSDDGAA